MKYSKIVTSSPTILLYSLFFFSFSINSATISNETKLLPSDVWVDEVFGDSVALDGNRALVGAKFHNIGHNSNHSEGAVYIYDFNGVDSWSETKLIASDNRYDDRFGSSVAIDGNIFIVGAEGGEAKGYNSGQAYVYEPDGLGGLIETKLTASDGASQDNFGQSVAISGKRILIGAPKSFSPAGAYLFQKGSQGWSETIVSSTDCQFPSSPSHTFGMTVAIDKERFVVGDPNSGPGAVCIFELDNTGGYITHTLTASDSSERSFGIDVAIKGNKVIVGSKYSVYVYDLDNNGTWQETKITPNAGSWQGDFFAYSVAIIGQRVIAGSNLAIIDGIQSGAVYFFDLDGNGGWEQTTITQSDAEYKDNFGEEIVASGDRILIGSPGRYDEYVSNFGAAYIFDAPLKPTLSCQGFDSPMDLGPVTVKKNRALPLKAQLFDAGGYVMSDQTIISSPVLQVLYNLTSSSTNILDVTDNALSAGNGTDGNQFEFTDNEIWQFNLKTKNYTATGTYSLSILSGDENEYVIDSSCTAQFVIK